MNIHIHEKIKVCIYEGGGTRGELGRRMFSSVPILVII